MIPAVINISSAEQVGEYLLRLTFDDGKTHDVNFKAFLSASAHPEIRAWLDPQQFASYRIENGELVWGDYALCFPMADLYRNCLGTPSLLEAA
jgi:hypothetical protein